SRRRHTRLQGDWSSDVCSSDLYDVCYIGDEVENPGRVIPRSIFISTALVAAIYLAINLSIIGVVPWRDFVPAAAHPQSNFVVSRSEERRVGKGCRAWEGLGPG